MPYSITKAAQLHLMKCLAQTQGSKVRVNAVLPGLLMTEWVSSMILSCGFISDVWNCRARSFLPSVSRP